MGFSLRDGKPNRGYARGTVNGNHRPKERKNDYY